MADTVTPDECCEELTAALQEIRDLPRGTHLCIEAATIASQALRGDKKPMTNELDPQEVTVLREASGILRDLQVTALDLSTEGSAYDFGRLTEAADIAERAIFRVTNIIDTINAYGPGTLLDIGKA